MIFYLTTCQNNQSTYVHSLENMNDYKKNMELIAKNKGYELKEIDMIDIMDQKIKHIYLIDINEKEKVEVVLKWLENGQSGSEYYETTYIRDGMEIQKEYNQESIAFYVELTNGISKKKISLNDICKEIDSAFEQNEKVRLPHDFFENHISYISYQKVGRLKITTEGVLYKTNRLW